MDCTSSSVWVGSGANIVQREAVGREQMSSLGTNSE